MHETEGSEDNSDERAQMQESDSQLGKLSAHTVRQEGPSSSGRTARNYARRALESAVDESGLFAYPRRLRETDC